MKRIGATVVVMAIVGCTTAPPPVEREPRPPRRAGTDHAEADEERDRRTDAALNAYVRRNTRDPASWYGTPGIRVGGGDILGFLFKLATRPADLLDFDPYKPNGGRRPMDERMERSLEALLDRYDSDRKR